MIAVSGLVQGRRMLPGKYSASTSLDEVGRGHEGAVWNALQGILGLHDAYCCIAINVAKAEGTAYGGA